MCCAWNKFLAEILEWKAACSSYIVVVRMLSHKFWVMAHTKELDRQMAVMWTKATIIYRYDKVPWYYSSCNIVLIIYYILFHCLWLYHNR